MPQAEIRSALAEDAVTIHHLLTDLAATLGTPGNYRGTVEDLLRHGFGATPHFHALLAEAEGHPIGTVLFFYTYSSWRGRLGIYVQDLHVIDAFRGTGVGRRLLAAAARQGHAEGCTHLRLSVDRDNAKAMEFYARMGLQRRLDETIHEVSGHEFPGLAERQS